MCVLVSVQSASLDAVYRAPISAVTRNNTSSGFSAGNSAPLCCSASTTFSVEYFPPVHPGQTDIHPVHPAPNRIGGTRHHTRPRSSLRPDPGGCADAPNFQIAILRNHRGKQFMNLRRAGHSHRVRQRDGANPEDSRDPPRRPLRQRSRDRRKDCRTPSRYRPPCQARPRRPCS